MHEMLNRSDIRPSFKTDSNHSKKIVSTKEEKVALIHGSLYREKPDSVAILARSFWHFLSLILIQMEHGRPKSI